ncbi:hypothetical protein A3A20_01765 [Candidatus Wolfebacteria bacterium RIFCSPLOWO2_01_FULL_45_19]|uniref:O-acetylhomoserine aminocarboxypropyltransferase n=1 Tax=Candidatus Wolfebacteria bacterium RIFCSPLOWO2_01_FULL_45_19 TaxID=1802557 RepID=A0A1F8DV19_9BACT|nr:MAG: hypothetical protein A3A20_01765 [Candidatus Wolfebacteria bacterium RIFCSPLOWO2_01_FULL_45_19]
MANKLWKLRPKTLEIHGGGEFSDIGLRPVVDRVTAYPLGSFERAKRLFEGSEDGFIYTRINNRTVDRLEKRIAALEGGEAGLATSSGMSAIMLLSLYLAHSGGHIVSSNRLYGGVFHWFREFLPKLGIAVTFVENPQDIEEWKRAIRPETKFLALENPSNPLIDVFDPRPIAKLAHREGKKFIVDSTLATPALAKPLKQGADIVWHSLSKYFGDGEVVGGCIVGKKELICDIRVSWFRDLGGCMSPDNAAIFLSHAESLFGRMSEHSRNASKVARFLSHHPKVKKVFYPAYGSHAAAARRFMPNGFGGLMAFEIKGGRREAKTVLESLKLFWHAPNIGESRSLVIHPATTTHGQLTPEELEKAKITEGILRLSIGREDPRDLIEDLRHALSRI